MKTRQGFVSNSSTSSFVVLGFKTQADKYYDHDTGWFLEGENCMLIGDRIASGSDCEFDETATDIGTLVQRSHQIAKEHDVPLESIKLYTGIRQC